MLLPEKGLVLYTFGNASQRDGDVFAIKPSGASYESLSWQDMVVVDLENRVVEGHLRPSSDTATHTVLYRAYNSMGGIVHTHSTYAVAWAQAQRGVPILGTTHADHLSQEIPCTPLMSDQQIQGDYETETGNQIVDTLANLGLSTKEISMVLVAGHGPFTWGINAAEAVYHSVVLEELCKMACLTEQISPQIAPLKEALIHKHYFRKHGEYAYYGQEQGDSQPNHL